MRTAKVISVSLSPDLNEEVQAIAKSERRSVSEVFREALRQYAALRVLSEARAEGRKVVKQKKVKPSDVAAIVASGRR